MLMCESVSVQKGCTGRAGRLDKGSLGQTRKNYAWPNDSARMHCPD